MVKKLDRVTNLNQQDIKDPRSRAARLRDSILNAFEQAGGVNYLVAVAHEDPKTFMTLLSRVLPTQIDVEVRDDLRVVDAINAARARALGDRAESLVIEGELIPQEEGDPI